ncbi:phage tail tape measure protein [Paenibacillus tritici]|uniref:Phage tail tape measure protein n=1 Tax=Paenibacillus tritici TaxID=1873425 RepID=A0ABX2DXL4_9BACL|nr:phage tail tape measure protein [Paenibacillus tritici]NQX49455.1 phage tail tape measure protein [Paenibacillus tritici]
MAGTGSPSGSINEIIVRLNVLVNPDFRRSVGEAEQHIEDLDRVLRELASRGYFDVLRREAEDADDSIEEVGDNAGKLGDRLKDAFNEVDFSMLQKAVEPLKAVWTAVNDSAGAMAQLQASTGLTAAEMSGMKEISDSLYSQNYGKNFEDIGDAVGTVKQVLGQTGDELEKTTQTAMTYRDVFKGDISDSVQAVDAMMQKFGISSEQAYNLMAQGAQKGMNTSGGLLNAVEKYSADFKKMGYSADEMFELLSSGMDNGADSIDGVAGIMKKFGSTVKEGSDSAKAAIYELFAPKQLDQFSAALISGGTKSKEFAELVKAAGKKGAVALVGDLKAGGDSANKAMLQLQKTLGNGDAIFKGMADGTVTGKEAMNQVIQKLKAIKDPAHQAALAGALFGSQFEEIGNKAVLSLGQTRHQFDMTRQTMDEVSAIKDNTLTEQFAAIGRELMSGLVVPLGESVMPALQGLTSWASDNKEALMVIGLAAPTAVLATKAVKIVQEFSTIIKAASGASGAAGGFAGALGLLTNPVGLAVAGVGLVTAGVIAFKKHQEDARQELLNMGGTLEESYANYSGIEEASTKTQGLITEYDRLARKIKDVKTPAAELAEARRKQKDVEQKLIDMNPGILSAEDLKSGRFSDQLGLVGNLAKAREEIGRRELEHDALSAQAKLPDLEDEYTASTEKLAKQNAEYETNKVKFQDYREYVNQLDEIWDGKGSEKEKVAQIDALRDKINKAQGTNYDVSGGWAIESIRRDYEKYMNSFDDQNAKIKETEGDINKAENSMLTYYNSQKKLIELNLGGTLEEQVAKYKDMSVVQKEQIDQAIYKVGNLTSELDKVPAEKMVNIMVLWQQTGQVPNWKLTKEEWGEVHKSIETNGTPNSRTKAGQKMNYLAQHDPGFEGYAEGGIAYVPSIFGEAGPEIAIPLNRKPRSRSLLEKANDLMGYNNNSVNNGDIHVTWAPNINLQGGDKSVVEQLRDALRQTEDGFERRFQAMLQQQRRVSFQ